MVEIHFFVLVFLSFLSFSLGRTFGRVESSTLFNARIQATIEALKKVEQLASLKGEDLSKLPTTEIVARAQKQLEIKNNDG